MRVTENLPAALTRMRRAYHDLCAPRVDGDGHTAPCLYAQLRDTIGGVQREGRAGAHSQPPLWVDAADLLRVIDSTVDHWHPERVDAEPSTVAKLGCLAERSWRPQDTPLVHEIADACEAWVREIVSLLDPEHTKHIRDPHGGGYAACPQCGARTARRFDRREQQWKRVPALQWRVNAGTTCLACQAHWGVEHTLWLGRVLGFELPDGVLA